MSFPKIPDIDPVIDIDSCDAVNLILTSIAMEEISLSKLMDAEQEKIKCVIRDSREGRCTVNDIVRVNKSAENMMKTLIKLQMLLQFKLENVEELMPCTTTTTTSTTSTTTTTSTTCTCSTTTRACSGSCLMGTAKGCVEDPANCFYGAGATLYAFIPCGDARARTVRFTVGNECEGLQLYASGRNVEVICPADCCRETRLRGRGRLRRLRGEDEQSAEEATFSISLCTSQCGGCTFRVQIISCREPSFEYDSGYIEAKDCLSNLKIGRCAV